MYINDRWIESISEQQKQSFERIYSEGLTTCLENGAIWVEELKVSNLLCW